jgi:hypothetical protein
MLLSRFIAIVDINFAINIFVLIYSFGSPNEFASCTLVFLDPLYTRYKARIIYVRDTLQP